MPGLPGDLMIRVADGLYYQAPQMTVGECVDDMSPVLSGPHQLCQAQFRQMLAHCGLCRSTRFSKSAHIGLTLGEQPQKVESRRVREQCEEGRRRCQLRCARGMLMRITCC
ncbi:hypothetical protein BBN63_00405 [Streptomyces niveus]|uniref:Uncharacterized protein n=1 Tax=Streptomyces niveus TaxID=193462 RepID=A0A1U9QMR8_STRNV|nr:hypothetical protein BBN63_00405 [Streptomyces niveus]